MIFLDYIYNKVYAPVEDDFGFDGDDLYEHWKVQVDANQDPVRIDKYLADKMAYQSRNRIQQAADAGFIHVNGKPVKSNYKVRPNDIVTLMLDRPRHETSIKPEEIDINVVYEDDQLMVVNKEAGMVVHPGAGNFHGTLIQAVAWHLRDMPEFDANDPGSGSGPSHRQGYQRIARSSQDSYCQDGIGQAVLQQDYPSQLQCAGMG